MSPPTAGGRWAIFAFSLIVFLAVGITSGRGWFADHSAGSSQPSEWQRAAQIEPGNGDYWYRLGLNRQWDLDNADPNQAISYFQRAVAIDPRSATYWTELADAYEAANQISAARESFQKALASYPSSSEVHWRYGSFLLRQGEVSLGYSEIHLALQSDPRLIPLAIQESQLAPRRRAPLASPVRQELPRLTPPALPELPRSTLPPVIPACCQSPSWPFSTFCCRT